MNKKIILVSMAFLLILSAVAPVMATQPKVWDEKNNDKFETFQVLGKGSFSVSLNPDNWNYIPSKEECNKLIVSWDEVFTLMQISVDENTYVMGTDFTYKGRDTMIFYDPVLPPPPPGYPFQVVARMWHSQVDYEYTFLAASGIEGTLRMQAIFKEGVYSISSLSGTGDLQNVQVKATSHTTGLPPHTPSWNIGHDGIVSGWPE